MALIDDFKLRFQTFDIATVDAILPPLIDSYQCLYNKEYDPLDLCTKEVILNLLAHMLSIEIMPGDFAASTMTSDSIGSISTSWADSKAETMKQVYFNTTKYGQKYLMLIKNKGRRVAFV